MRRVQQLHLWLGTLFAPLILFFALTGALQTFNLHEKPGTPGWVARLAQVHKNQNLAAGEHHEESHDAEDAPAPKRPRPAAERPNGPSPLPLKIFVALMSLGLTVTTGLGIWMAFKYSKNKAVVWGLLIVGTVLPIALLFV